MSSCLGGWANVELLGGKGYFKMLRILNFYPVFCAGRIFSDIGFIYFHNWGFSSNFSSGIPRAGPYPYVCSHEAVEAMRLCSRTGRSEGRVEARSWRCFGGSFFVFLVLLLEDCAHRRGLGLSLGRVQRARLKVSSPSCNMCKRVYASTCVSVYGGGVVWKKQGGGWVPKKMGVGGSKPLQTQRKHQRGVTTKT